jgi:hypothetical protein
LPEPVPARDEDVQPGLDARPQELEHLRRRGARSGQVVDRVRRVENFRTVITGPIRRQRRDDCVDPRAVGKSGVDARARLVEAPAERGDDPVDDPEDVLVVQEDESTAGSCRAARCRCGPGR